MFPKKYIFILIFIFAILLCGKEARAATEFISTIRASGGNYSLLSTWEAAVQSDLTASTTVVYSGTGAGGISAGATLELFRGGAYQNITALKIATTSSQLLVQTFTGSYKVLQNNDQWRVASSTDNMWTVSSAGLGDSAIAVAQIDGAWAAADTTAVTISGWTTSANNYIRIYATPEARHKGIAGTGYRLKVSTPNVEAINIYEDYVRLEYIDVSLTNNYASNRPVIDASEVGRTNSKDIRLIGLIIHDSSSAGSSVSTGIKWTNINNPNAILYVVNTLIYNCDGSGISVVAGSGLQSNLYVYNSTITNNAGVGIGRLWAGTVVIKNTYAGGNALGDYIYDGGTTLITSASSDSSGSAGLRNIAVSNSAGAYFMNLETGGENFHIQLPSLLKDAGTDLSADANLSFSDDIDGQTRAGTWDIGADETAENIYRSVGPSKTTALVSGASYGALTVSGSTATFVAGLPDEVGVGDALQYDDDGDGDIDASDSIVFIHFRTSSTTYMVKTASGAVPIAVAGDTDWSLFRAYISLANAETGTENTGIDADLRNFDSWTLGKDISSSTGSNEQWNIACYANETTADTSSVTINGWTTTADNYIKIYTPVSSSEVGISQRHNGKWDEGKYRITTISLTAITITEENVRIEGLQIHVNATDIRNAFSVNPSGIADVRISHNIAYSTSPIGYGIIPTGGTVGSILKAWNNILYNYNAGIYGNSSNYTYYVYNNTVYGCGKGYSRAVGGTFIVKNNIAYNNTDNYYGTFTSSTNNLSGPTQTDAPGTNPINAAKVIFLNEANDDFHLAPNDYSAVNAGADLSADSYLDFTDDIDGETRPVGAVWDIGADETALTKFRFDGGQMKIRGTIKFE